MKTYIVFVDYFIHGKRPASYLYRTKRFVIDASDILTACSNAIARVPGSAVSMIWPKL